MESSAPQASRGPLTEDGLSKMEELCELHGTGALITLLPAAPIAEAGQDEQDVPLLSALLQLKQEVDSPRLRPFTYTPPAAPQKGPC